VGTRPTSDRVREALFSTLATIRPLAGAAVLDLYAGSGALAIEALSRGAARAVLVESDQRALAAIDRNLVAVGLSGAEVVAGPVERYATTDGFDLVLADPPYGLPAERLAAVLAGLRLNAGAVVVVERRRGDPWEWPARFLPIKDRRYGETMLWYGRAAEGMVT
jgi:16S rRNA (guanine966-N2)-methyltransferase